MIGLTVRLHDLTGDDLGTVHLPGPLELDDLVATETAEYRIVDVVAVPAGSSIDALAKVQPTSLRPLASR